MPEAGKVTSVVEVDVSTYKANMNDAAKAAVDSSAKRVDAATKAATAEEKSTAASERNAQREAKAKKAQADAAAFAAKYEGEAVQERTIRIMTAYNQEKIASQELAKARRLEKEGFGGAAQAAQTTAAAYQRLAVAKLALAEATKVEAVVAHASVNEMQATSAAVRSLEGNPGIRAVERFLTTIPGVGAALKLAFPLIGGIALGAMVVELGEKVEEFIKKVNKMPVEITNAFRDLHLAASLANDELRLTNDRLQNNIDKLSGKPQNNLAIALDESRIAADKLATSLMKDMQQVDQLLERYKIGVGGQLLGQGSTVDVAGSVVSYRQDLANLGSDLQDATHTGNAAEMKRLDGEIAAKRKSYSDWLSDQIKERTGTVQGGTGVGPIPYAAVHGGQGANLAILKGERSLMYDRADQDSEEKRNAKLVPEDDALKAKKSSTEAAKRADEERLKQDEAALAAEELLHNVSKKREYDYWDDRKEAYTVGSEAYRQIVMKQAQIATASSKEAESKIKAYTDERKRQASEDQVELPRMLNRNAEDMRKGAVKDAGEAGQDAIDSNQLALQDARNTAREKEARITDEAGRSITRHAAAMQLATVHAQLYSAELFHLQSVLDVRQRAEQLDSSRENKARTAAAQRELAGAVSSRSIQMQGDNEAIYGRATSGLVGFQDALAEIAERSRDASGMVRQFTQSVVGEFNSTLLRTLTTRTTGHQNREAFGDLGASIFRGAAGKGLDYLEGGALKMFGLGGGKGPKGTAADPMYVAFATKMMATGGVVTGAASSLLKDSGGWLGKAGGFLASHLPAFAAGGAIDEGTAAIIGEKGPEVFIPRSAGTIIPNHKVTMGGGDTHHITINAQGATNPAMVRAMVMDGIRQAAPHIVAGANRAMRDNSYRMPSNRR